MTNWLRNAGIGIGIGASLAACASPAASNSAAPASSHGLTASSPAATTSPDAAHSPATAICGPADIVARRMGLKNFTVYNATTDPNHLLGRQGEYTSKINWGQDRGNGDVFSSIEAFPDVADARLRYTYLRAFRPPIGDGYDYLYRAAILRLNSIYTPAQASALKASFKKACRESS